MGNRLLVFSVQLCFVLHAERHYFSIENPLGSWTWAVAAVARLHAMPGVATVQVYYDQFGTRYSKPTLFLHNLPLLHKLSVPPRATPDEAIVLRGQCWYKGEWRFKTSPASPYPPLMTKLMARLINESLSMKNSASRRERIPLAPASHDDGRPFPAVGPMAPPEGHACYIEGVDLLAGNMFIPDHVRSAVARAHFTGADDNDDNEGDDLVPYGLGSKRGWLPSDHVQWALVQPHPFKNQEAKLDLKLQLAFKESAALKPEDLDKLRTERLQYWTLRALQLEEERARWVTEAPPQLQRMLTSVHGPQLGRLLACRRVVGVAALVDAIRVHVCQLCVAPYRQSPQGHHSQGLLGAHVQVCGRLLRLRPGGLHGHGGLLPDGHVQSARLPHGP